MDEEKRVAPRFLFTEPVGCDLPEVSINGGIAGNISLSGMSLKVQGFIPMGVVLQLKIRLDQSPKVMWVKAQVVRIREVLSEDCYEIGLKFIEDQEFVKAVDTYINSCRPKQTN